MSEDERFEAKWTPEPNTGCWLWTGATDRKGYGQFRSKGAHVKAHRWSYERLVGPIPEGLQIDHLCRVPGCVNPEHLEPVTHRENQVRGLVARGATAQHGTPSMYSNADCRCRPCTDAQAAYDRGYRARKLAEVQP